MDSDDNYEEAGSGSEQEERFGSGDDFDDDEDGGSEEQFDGDEEEDEEDGDYDGEEGDEDGDEEYDDGEGGASHPVIRLQPIPEPNKKKHKKEHYALPTREEQQALRETENLFHTNLMKLQVDEMLREVCVDHSKSSVKTVERHLFDLKEFLESLKPCEMTASSIKSPAIRLENYHNTPVSLAFQPPSSIDVVGSFMLQTLTKPYRTVDVSVQMPSACFTPRDILNHQYFDKRKLYLYRIAQALSQRADLATDVHFTFFRGDIRKPVLVYTPAAQTAFTVRILPSIAPDTFRTVQLLPTKNNVRPRAWMAQLKAKNRNDENLNSDELPPTPHYNMAILEDMTFARHLELLWGASNMQAGPGSVNAAIILLKIWLTQRDTRDSTDSIDSATVALLVAYLLQQRLVNARMSALQIFQTTMRFLADIDFKNTNMELTSSDDAEASPAADTYRAHFPALLMDSDGVYNILWRVSESALKELQAEAKAAVASLQRPNERTVQQLFLQRLRFWRRYDAFIQIPLTDDVKTAVDACPLGDRPAWHYVAQTAEQVLNRALGNRVHLVRAYSLYSARNASTEEANVTWTLEDKQPQAAAKWVSIGVSVNPEESHRILDKGPMADDEAACAEFREFWGDKSGLRRFKDGTIVEAVVWGASGEDADVIFNRIVRYALGRHLGYCCGNAGNGVRLISNQLEQSLPRPGDSAQDTHGALTRKAITALDHLRPILQNLQGLPLQIETISPVSPYLRYTSFFPPFAHPLVLGTKEALKANAGKVFSRCVAPIPVLIHFETSGKWPDEVEALRRAKLAFLIRIGECLEQQRSLNTILTHEGLDIFVEGFVFRANIVCEKEAFLLSPAVVAPQNLEGMAATAAGPVTASQLRSSVASAAHDPEMERDRQEVVVRDTISPLHHVIIHGVQAVHPSFGATVRLLWRWLAENMFSEHIRMEALELLAAHVYLQPTETVQTPHSALSGFLRCLLLLAEHDWVNVPLVVDLQQDIKPDDYDSIQIAFDGLRGKAQEQGGPSLYIVASYDRNRSWVPSWTNDNPEPVVFREIVAAAADTARQLLAWMSCPSSAQDAEHGWVQAFATSKVATAADVLFRVTKSLARGKLRTWDAVQLFEQHREGPSFARLQLVRNLSKAELSQQALLITEHPLLSRFNEVRRQYKRTAVLFLNALALDVVALAWRPDTLTPKAFSILESRHRRLQSSEPEAASKKRKKTNAAAKDSSDSMTLFNAEEVVCEMMVLFKRMVDDVAILSGEQQK